MVESATVAAGDAAGGSGRKCGRRSDGGSAIVGYLGDFTRGHVVFAVYRIGPDQSRYPNGPSEYLVDCDDGVGPHEVCRFTEEDANARGFDVIWRGSWNGDEWCDWIMERARVRCRALRPMTVRRSPEAATTGRS